MEEIVQLVFPLITALTFCTPRLLTAFLVVPFFSDQMITGICRNCIVLVFSLILFPTVTPFLDNHELSIGFILVTVAKEAVIGGLIGFLAGLFFYTLEAVGYLIDQQRGASFASMMDPSTGSQTTPMGSLFTQITIVLFITSGGLILFLSGLYESFRVWPIMTYWPRFDAEFAQFFLARVDDLMALALLLVSPVLIALFLSEFGLGLINRFAPQLNVFFLSMPIKSAVGLLIIIFYLRFMLTFVRDLFFQRFDLFNLLHQVVQ